MEGIRATRRAASHGALNSAYNSMNSSHSRPSPLSLSRHGSRPNLRSVNELSALLHSPGPLESMLKTTTETGDIGAFSIRPSATFHQLPRKPSSNWDDAPAPRRRSESADRHGPPRRAMHDDRRRLPSYRDPSTSEIISMYGSGSQRSGSSFHPPPFDDMGHRSYSMTSSYGSKSYTRRHPEDYTPSGTMPSMLQRPRSPFPYPTRLKRPGVRPSSPALTENGNVDYTKMIGIDRVSYRTDYHRAYRPQPPYHQGGRRRPPLSLRPEAQRAMRSYPSHGSYRSQLTNSSGAETHDRYLPNRPPVPWGGHSSEGTDYGPGEMRLGNSSFGSLIDKYRYSSPTDSSPQNLHVPSGSFYYDYSEEFESPRPDGGYRPRSPLVPLSAQAPSSRRAFAYGEHSADPARSCIAPSPSELSALHTDDDADHGPDQYEKLIAEYMPLVPSTTPVQSELLATLPQFDPLVVIELLTPESKRVTNLDLSTSNDRPPLRQSRTSTLLGKRGTWSPQGRTLEIGHMGDQRGTQRASTSNILDASSTLEMVVLSGDVGHQANDLKTSLSDDLAKRPPDPADENSHSYDDGASSECVTTISPEKAAPNTALDMDTFSKTSNDVRRSLDSNSTRNGIPLERTWDTRASRFPSAIPGTYHTFTDNHVSEDMYPQDHPRSLMRRHRHNQAMLRISQSSGRVPHSLSPTCDSPARSESPMLAPKPISPAKELRVRNSIPQLMKALPALPGDRSQTSSSPDFSVEDMDYGVPFAPVHTTIVSTTTSRSNQTRVSITMDVGGPMGQIHEETEEQTKASRMRSRMASPESTSTRVETWTQPAAEEEFEVEPLVSDEKPHTIKTNKNKKLRLRILRNAFHHNASETGTVRRRSRPENAAPISLSSPRSSHDLDASSRREHEPAFINSHADAISTSDQNAVGGRFDETASLPPTSPRQRPADIGDVPRGTSLDTHLDRPILSGTTIIATTSAADTNGQIMDAVASETVKRKGPRKRFSNLKLRLTESLTRNGGRDVADALKSADAKTESAVGGGDHDEAALLTPPDSRSGASIGSKGGPLVADVVGRHHKSRVRRKLSKLVKGARQTLHLYIRKRHPSVVAQ